MMTAMPPLPLAIIALFAMITTTHAYSKYGRTCSDIGCTTNEVCVMAEDPCSYGTRDACGSYPTCQRRMNAVSTCETFVCPPTTYCRQDGNTPKCIPDNGPLGGKTGNPNANLDPHAIGGGNGGHHSGSDERPSAPLYPQIPHRGQTTTRSPMYRPNNGGSGGGYQGGAVGSGYPGYPGTSGGGGGYGGGSIGGGYPGGYSGYPSAGQNPYNRPSYPNGGGGGGGGGYPSSGSGGNNGYSNYPYNTNPYYSTNNNNRYGGNSGATTSNPLYDSLKDTLKSIGLFCFLLHTIIAQLRQV